jgi:putative ABC transport system permease protein
VIGSLQIRRNGPGPAPRVPAQTALIQLYTEGGAGFDPYTGVAPVLTRLETALEGLPGIASVGVTSVSPFGSSTRDTIAVGGRDVWTDIEARRAVVTPGYFDAVGIPLLSGRIFDRRDDALFTDSGYTWAPGGFVAVINERMANRFWPGRDVIGEKLRYGTETVRRQDPYSSRPAELTIIGVVRDSAATLIPGGAEMNFYVPRGQAAVRRAEYLVIRSSDPTLDLSDGEGVGNLASDVRAEIQKVFPGPTVGSWMSSGGDTSDRPGSKLFQPTLLILFGALALLHAARTMLGVWRLHRLPDGQSR